ncbi:IS5 family transposase [Streptomyces spongiicola]|uniref:IS5 family transposase n=1 Tax=Streptomyces spongiicola TaxID=1690221 RepID=A0ABM6V6C1_9ACTN|nr:IS5 family transposase [Streptomyces spongiicola]AWK09563.1 IS5 family transposase [Streptomyces spongiicola]
MQNATVVLSDRPLPDLRFAAECDCLAHLYGNAGDRPLRARVYATDLTDEEWQIVRRVMPVPGWLCGRGGNPEGFCHREMIDAVRYFVDNGIEWRAMPPDFPPWSAVYAFQHRWHTDELLDVLHERLREQVRIVEGRDDPEPSAAIVDSQSLRGASTLTGERRGYDGAKNVSGSKRHIAVDCLGLLLVVMVTAADLQDRDAGVALLERVRSLFTRVRLVWADSGYAGALVDWALHALGMKVEVSRRGDDRAGFVVIPRRWVVERTFAWLVNCRRLVRDYERTAAAHESYVKWAMVTLMTRRLAAADHEAAAGRARRV